MFAGIELEGKPINLKEFLDTVARTVGGNG
jgi:hypothetical protein